MPVNLSRNAYFYQERNKAKHKAVNLINFGKRCQKSLIDERMRVAREFAQILGYELVPRKETTQYNYKTKPRIKINGKSYIILPLKSPHHEGEKGTKTK